MKCGFYETEITPPLGTTMFGYFTKRVNEGIKQKLYAKAAVFEKDDTCAAFLVIDSTSMPTGLPEAVRKRVHARTGIAEDAILIAVTHSHTSIPCRKIKPGYQEMHILKDEPELDPELDAKTMEMITLLAADTVIMAYKKMEEATLRFGIGDVEGMSFVREYYIEDGTIRTNPGYCKDKIVKPYSKPETVLPVLYAESADGRPMGIITSFALHHDTVSGSEISSDYSGVTARMMKEKYGLDFVTVFYQGFCGNINHINYIGEPFKHTAEEIGTRIAEEMFTVIPKAEPLKNDDLAVVTETIMIKKRELPEGFMESVKELQKNPPTSGPMTIADPYSDRMKYAASADLIAVYDTDKRTKYEIPVQVIKIGDCLVYAFIGEVFSQFADRIRAASPTEKNIMIELAHVDEPSAYIPIPELYLPYVYEASIYSDPFVPEAGTQMVEKALEMAKKIY